jgi:hypothetical protein
MDDVGLALRRAKEKGHNPLWFGYSDDEMIIYVAIAGKLDDTLPMQTLSGRMIEYRFYTSHADAVADMKKERG